jgi:hypothetical protein
MPAIAEPLTSSYTAADLSGIAVDEVLTYQITAEAIDTEQFDSGIVVFAHDPLDPRRGPSAGADLARPAGALGQPRRRESRSAPLRARGRARA